MVTRAIQARPLAGGQPAAPDALPPGMGIRFEVAYARTREALARFVSDTLGVPSRGTRSIEAVAGEEEGQAGYVVRFGEAAAGEQPDAPLTAADVGRAFAFRAQIDWGRILSLGWKIGLVALVLLAIVLALIWS
ncbi:MAG: hypothetical protein HY744_01845 [Deltaproteobacteria bacterium]|nr:hypothetical protein [Deltaproteobacteria bacterium]